MFIADKLWHDVRFGLRLLRKSPGVSAVAVLTLALGIGANTAMFSVIYASMIEPMPYPNPDRLVMVWSKLRGGRNGVSTEDYLDWKKQSNVFVELSAWTGESFNVSASNAPEQIDGRLVTPGFFSLMKGIPPVLGRDFLPEEGEAGKNHVLILTHALWMRRFGGDPHVVGEQVRVEGENYTVVGVLPEGSFDRLQAQMFAPLAFTPGQMNRKSHWLLVQGRLKPGATVAQAQAEMNVITQQLATAYPETNKLWSSSVEPLHDDFFPRDTQNALWFLMTAVAFVLLMACVNAANLLLARGLARQKEIAVRASSGASRAGLFRQFLIESVTLAVIGAAVGTAFAWAMMKAVMALMPDYTLPAEANVRLSLPVLGFTLLVSTLVGVLFGTAPAWQAARLNLNEVLKDTGHTTAGAARHRLRRALVIIEFSLALTLLAGAGLAIHSFWKLQNVDLGIRKDHVLTFRLPMPASRLPHDDQIIPFYRQLLKRIEAIPGVQQASASVGLPVEGAGFFLPFSIAGVQTDVSAKPNAGVQMVTPGYYETFGIQPIRGRVLTERDGAGGAHVALVNETFVKRYLGDADPLSQRVVVQMPDAGPVKQHAIEWQIVGVFHDVRNGGVMGQDFPEIDIPFWQSPWPQAAIAVRTTNDPATVRSSIAAVVKSIDADLPIADVMTVQDILDDELSGSRFATALLGTFAGMGLVLAALGIYGVISFSVAQRTHEIGVRMALGASSSRVLLLILQEGMALALAGMVLGLGGAYLVGRVMKAQLYGIGPMDPLALGAVTSVLISAALLACCVPAWRAMRVEPMVALRHE